jgi:hypothetical protein
MQQSAIMRGSEASADLVRGLQSLVGGQPAYAAQQRRKILTIHVFHGEKVPAVHLADVVDTTNIRMRNLAGISHFSMKAGQSRPIVLQRGRKKLESYHVSQLEILGAIDLAHAAAAQKSYDPISFGENRPGHESSVSGRMRTCGNRRRQNGSFIRFQRWCVGHSNGTPACRTETDVLGRYSPATGASDHSEGIVSHHEARQSHFRNTPAACI